MTNWEEIAKMIVPEVLEQFYQPLISPKIHFEEELKKGDTAYFDFVTNETFMNPTFLDQLSELGGLEREVAIRGVYKHEVGHYFHYPKECSKLMFLGHIAESNFKKHQENVMAYWVDVMDNVPQILKKIRGQDVRDLYRGMNMMSEKETEVQLAQLQEKGTTQEKIDKVREVHREYSIDRLLTAYYQRQSGEDLGVDISGTYLEKKMEEMMSINFMDTEAELPNFILFGSIISDLCDKIDEHMPKQRGNGQQGKSQPGNGQPGNGQPCNRQPGEPGQPDNFDDAERGQRDKDSDNSVMGDLEDIKRSMKSPQIGDAPKLDEFSRDQLEEGLDGVIRDWGKWRYEKVKEYVEGQTGRKFDLPSQGGYKGIGLGKTSITFNDDQIPYYERISSTYGLYIHRKPVVVDVVNSYPEGSKTFRVGDPVRSLNVFSTGGKVLPGITKRFERKQGHKLDRLYRVPHLSLWIDSSGSMQNVRNGSVAAVAGFVMARNYWENDAKVGVINFSAEMACLLPTREIQDVYSMLCAWWGGGTVLNTDKIKEYMRRVHTHDGERAFTTENIEDVVSRMHPEERKKFEEKHVTVELKEIKETYEKMDNIMITDGGIYNIEEVVAYMNETAEYTRNVVCIVGARSEYESWKKLNLPNTQLIAVNKPKDLMSIAIGEVKDLGPKNEKPSSLFYR